MTSELLTVTAQCRANATCLFQGHDMFIDVTISNKGDAEIGYPLAYVQKTGPIVRLVDRRTGAETYLRTNLAPHDLREQFSSMAPGESLMLEWVITAYEIRQIGGSHVDVSAEITVAAKVRAGGELVDFRGADTLHITGEGRS